jgi:hypothetical protein
MEEDCCRICHENRLFSPYKRKNQQLAKESGELQNF